jgi:hypothetical protein
VVGINKLIQQCYKLVIIAINKLFKVDVSYISLVISPYPHYTNGKINKNMPSEEYGGSYCYNDKIYINPNYKLVWKHYNMSYTNTIDDITKWYVQIISHELGHALHRNHPESLPLDTIKKTTVKSKYLDMYKDGGKYAKGNDKYFSEKVAEWVSMKVIKYIFE